MTLAKIIQNDHVRVRQVKKTIGHADLTASATTQKLAFDAALLTNAAIIASWFDVDETFKVTVAAAAAVKTGADGPYALTAGQDVVLDTDDIGNKTATFDAAAGTQECNTYFPVSDLDGLKVKVAHDGGADEEVTFTTPCTTEAHVTAQISAQTTGVALSAATTAKAAFLPTNTVDAPFEMVTDGLTVIQDVDDAGADTATWNIAQAVAAGSGLNIVDIDGETLIFELEDSIEQTITFSASDTDVTKAAATINAAMFGGRVEENAGEMDMYSDHWGTGSHVNITGGTARAELGLAIADNVGTGDAVDGRNITIAEIKTWLEGDITGSSGITITDLGNDRFSTTSNTTGVNSELDTQASTALVALGLSVAVVIGTALQPKITSDLEGTSSSVAVTDVDSGLTWGAAVAGTGDAANIAAVTSAEVKTVFEADTDAEVVLVGAGYTMNSPSTGLASELDYKSGSALATLGLSVEKINGTAAVTGTMTADFAGDTDGDADALIDGGDLSTAAVPVNGPKGVASDGFYSEKIPAVTMNGTLDCDQYTSGSMTANILYVDTTRTEF